MIYNIQTLFKMQLTKSVQVNRKKVERESWEDRSTYKWVRRVVRLNTSLLIWRILLDRRLLKNKMKIRQKEIFPKRKKKINFILTRNIFHTTHKILKSVKLSKMSSWRSTIRFSPISLRNTKRAAFLILILRCTLFNRPEFRYFCRRCIWLTDH